MNTLVILRNIFNNPDLFDDEQYLSTSDINVILEALHLRKQCGGLVSVILFAEDVEDSKKALMKAYTYGVDNAVHIAFKNFDFSCTDRLGDIIAKTIETYFKDYDLIMFGRLAYDGDAVTLATRVSEKLKIPRVTYSENCIYNGFKMMNTRFLSSDHHITTFHSLPLLVHSIRKDGLKRQPFISDIVSAYNEKKITKIAGEPIEELLPSSLYKSSCDFVCEENLSKSNEQALTMLNGSNDMESAQNLINLLKELGYSAK
ncbi:MAG: hypothetical protein K6E13_09870 [Lachnospiraceae bacterium]|nr:hypothetical protein [Lachnospiraceae bacterium]